MFVKLNLLSRTSPAPTKYHMRNTILPLKQLPSPYELIGMPTYRTLSHRSFDGLYDLSHAM